MILTENAIFGTHATTPLDRDANATVVASAGQDGEFNVIGVDAW
jgi:hypothetical protein